MSIWQSIRKALFALVCTGAAILLSPPRPVPAQRGNVSSGDTLVRCYVMTDASASGERAVNGGMSAFLLRRYASEARVKPEVNFLRDGALDSLLSGKVEVVAAMAGDSLDIPGILVSRQFGDSLVWVVRSDDPTGLLALNAWLTDLTPDYAHLKKDYLRSRRTGWQISPFDEHIKKYAAEFGWDWRLVSAVIRHESRFRIDAVSPRGAIGLMQILPYRSSAEQLSNPEFNIRAGAEHLSRMRKMFKPYSADAEQNVKFTLAAYNCGEGRVLQCIRFAESIGVDARNWDTIAVRAIPRMRTFSGKQTIPYVDSVLRTYHRYQVRYPD